jgi:hypothetical protein
MCVPPAGHTVQYHPTCVHLHVEVKGYARLSSELIRGPVSSSESRAGQSPRRPPQWCALRCMLCFAVVCGPGCRLAYARPIAAATSTEVTEREVPSILWFHPPRSTCIHNWVSQIGFYGREGETKLKLTRAWVRLDDSEERCGDG